MDLNELQSVRDRERQTDKLQQLRESFYADAGAFIQQLRAERDRAVERVEDPFDSPDVRQLSDEIKTAEQTVEAIYEKRVGKIVKAASFAAADLPAEADGMTAEEQALFDDLVGDIEASRGRVLDLLDDTDTSSDRGETSEDGPPASPAKSRQDGPSAGPETPAAGTDGSVTAADAMGGEPTGAESAPSPTASEQEEPATERETPPSPAADEGPPSATPVDPPVREDGGRLADGSASTEIERRRVQVLEDVDTFVGFDDRDYDLEPDDVVSLPATNADILLDRGVARKL